FHVTGVQTCALPIFYGSLMNNHEPNLISWPNVMVLGSASLFAVGTELIQKFFFDYRSFEYWDIFADHVGIGMAYFAYLVLVLTRSEERRVGKQSTVV